VDVPLLWIHGTADGTNSIETTGQIIWNNYSGDGASLIVVGAAHITLPTVIGYSDYKELVLYFIRGDHRSHPDLYSTFK
jgi:hypothetical protein